MRRTFAAATGLALCALALAGAAVADNGGFSPEEPASPTTDRINDLYWLLVAIAAFVLAIVTVPLLVFVVRYRSRGAPRSLEGPQVRGHARLEIGWTVGAVALVGIVVAFTFYKLPGIIEPAEAETGDLRVRVEGRQFYWRYVYENGVVAFNELRLPQGRPVEVVMTAPERDVIHSFWVPELAGKRDAIPGQETSFELVPERPGRFEVVCGEFCGLQHAAMRGAVVVVEEAEFDGWLADQEQRQARPDASLGGTIYAQVCATCHGPEVVGEVGPRLEGNPILGDAAGVEQIVRNGRGAMPPVGQGWTEGEVESLTEFVKALAPQDSDGG